MTQNSKNPLWINVALVIACLLVLAGVWLYLAGGIFLELTGGKIDDAKFLTAYEYWKFYGGNPVVMQKLYIAGGISAAILLLPILLFLKRNKLTLHGDAKWASKMEIKKAGLLDDKGIIVGKIGKQYLMFGGQQHVLLAAPTRSGKGVGIVIPNLLTFRDSVVVLDIKQENYDLTAGFRAKHGQDVYLFNPVATDFRTHRWNPLLYISKEPIFRVNDVQKIANFLFPDQEGQDPIWSASSRSLFVGVVLFIIETPPLPLTMGEVLRQATKSEEAGKYFQRMIAERIESGNPLSAQCVSSLSDFIATSTNTRTSIRKTFTSRLELWFNPLVDAATEVNDFDLREVRKKRMSIYIGITPDNLARMQPIINLFFQQLLDLNTTVLPQSNPELKYSCLLLMDEFTSIGKVPILSKGISYIAGYNLRMLPIIQSPAQIREVYGDDAAETFFDNHALHIIYTPKNVKVAQEISDSLGYQTWKVKSFSKAIGMSKGSNSESTSDQRRALLLPQEVRELGQDSEILLLENLRPVMCEKIRYYADETFKNRLIAAPPVPVITITQLAAPTQAPEAPSDADDDNAESGGGTVIEERPVAAADLDKLDTLSLDDFSCDFSSVVLETNAKPSEAELQGLVDDLLLKFGMGETA